MKKALFILNVMLVPFLATAQTTEVTDSIVPVRHKEGMKQFYLWANERMTAKDSLQGCKMCTVTVSAVLDSIGNFDSVWVSQSVNDRLDKNALRILKASQGQWVPGMSHYSKTSELHVPIDFKGKHGWDPTIQDTGVHIYNGIMYRDAGFKGGKRALTKYLGDRLKYPGYSKEMQIEGEVIIAFTIDKKGLVVDPYVKKKVYGDIDAEALRVVKQTSGYYNPRMVNGLPVDSKFEVPVMFKLNNVKKKPGQP